uniref:Uncharacterized protein n=1 Tax=Arundo donax TaxID=35708 RepID=A0A0A9GZH5_ARUDO
MYYKSITVALDFCFFFNIFPWVF